MGDVIEIKRRGSARKSPLFIYVGYIEANFQITLRPIQIFRIPLS